MSATVSIDGVSYTVPTTGDDDWGAQMLAFQQAVVAALAGRAPSVLGFGSATPNNTSSNFLRPWGDAGVTCDTTEYFIRVPFACTLSKLYLQTLAALSGHTLTVTARKNGSDTTLTVAVADGATQAADTIHSVSFAAGDRLSFKVVSSANTAAAVYATVKAVVP